MSDLRHTTHRCERCPRVTELFHVRQFDEYWCDDCIQSAAESAYERLNEDFHDGGSTQFVSLADQQATARKLK